MKDLVVQKHWISTWACNADSFLKNNVGGQSNPDHGGYFGKWTYLTAGSKLISAWGLFGQQ